MRREFIKQSGLLALVATTGLLTSCSDKANEKEKPEVTPVEDLMQEHGIINRIMLIYDDAAMKLTNQTRFDPLVLQQSSAIIRRAIEDYHEKQEEQYVFPRVKAAGQHIDIINVLLQQHRVGRTLTDGIHTLATEKVFSDSQQRSRLVLLLEQFNSMYRHHETREDTVVFRTFRTLLSKQEYGDIGEAFEKNEKKLLGEGGYDEVLGQVIALEKQLGIDDLAKFTPRI